jgi:carbon storage regulator
MLVLRRRAGEAIVNGDDIEIEVTEISRTRVKLGVKAPRTICVMRRETVPVALDNRQAAVILGNHGVGEILRRIYAGQAVPPAKPFEEPRHVFQSPLKPPEERADK